MKPISSVQHRVPKGQPVRWGSRRRSIAVRSVPLVDEHMTGSPLPDGNWQRLIPVVGESLPLLKQGALQFGAERHARYGPVFRTTVFGMDAYFISDFPTIKKEMDADLKLTATSFPKSWEIIFGRTNIDWTSNLEINQRMRRQVAAVLKPGVMGEYADKLEEIVTRHLAQAAKGGAFDLHEFSEDITVDLATSLVAGMSIEDVDVKDRIATRLPQMLVGAFDPFGMDLPGFALYEGKAARKELFEVLRPGVLKHKAEALQSIRTRAEAEKNFLSQYLAAKIEDGEELGDDEALIELVLAILFAGYETSAASIRALLAVLAMAPPDVWENLREEQARIIAKHGAAFSGEALEDMKYAYATVREALRIFPPVTMLYRKVLQDHKVHGKLVPKGSYLWFNLVMAAAQDPNVQPSLPDNGVMNRVLRKETVLAAFRPERWLDDKRPPPTLGTFGIGPHFCIGYPLFMLEAKGILAALARSYQLSLDVADIEWDVSRHPVPLNPTTVAISHLGRHIT